MPESSSAIEPDASPAVATRSFRRRFLSGSAWIATGRVASVGTLTLTRFVLARAMDKGENAAYVVAIELATVLAVFVGVGCPQILMRDVRRMVHSDSPNRAHAAVRSCAWLSLITCLALSVCGGAVAPLASHSAEWSAVTDYTWWVVALSCALGCGVVAAYALQGLDDFRTAVMIGSRGGGVVPNVAVLATVSGVWLVHGGVTLTLALGAQTLWAAIVLPLAWLAILRRLEKSGAGAAPSGGERELTVGYYLRESWPCLVSQLTVLAVDRLDVLWVAAFESGEAVADYGNVKVLVRLVAAPYLMFVMSMGPFTAELLEKREYRRLERVLRGSTSLVGLPMLAVCAVYFFMPSAVIRWTLGSAYEGAAPLLQILSAGFAFRVLLGASGQALIMSGFQRLNMIQTVAALALYAAAAPLAMQRYGVLGAAVVYSIWIVLQGLAGTLLVRWKLGIWTTASLSPRTLAEYVRALASRRNQ